MLVVIIFTQINNRKTLVVVGCVEVRFIFYFVNWYKSASYKENKNP